MSRSRFWLMTGTSTLVLLLAGATAPPLGAQTATPATGSAESAAQRDERLARGAYIVENVAQCGRCHSPVDNAGERDRTRWLMGGPLDVAPTIAKQNWVMAAPRIAGAPPGTDEQFVRLLMTGVSRTGGRLSRPMPEFRMTQADAEAVLAYLKSLTGRGRIGSW